MRVFALVLLGLVVTISPALSGPNEGVFLAVHGFLPPIQTFEGFGQPIPECEVPEDCLGLQSSGQPTELGIEWFSVVVLSPPSNDPNFQSICFGIRDYNPINCYVGFFGPCHWELDPLEVHLGDWPRPFSGTCVSWAPHCLTSHIEPVYYFGIYVYYGGGEVPLGDGGVGNPPMVASCGEPPEVDPFEDFGVMGCGDAEGYNPECFGSSSVEDPDPVIEGLTWGRIKRMYR